MLQDRLIHLKDGANLPDILVDDGGVRDNNDDAFLLMLLCMTQGKAHACKGLPAARRNRETIDAAWMLCRPQAVVADLLTQGCNLLFLRGMRHRKACYFLFQLIRKIFPDYRCLPHTREGLS